MALSEAKNLIHSTDGILRFAQDDKKFAMPFDGLRACPVLDTGANGGS